MSEFQRRTLSIILIIIGIFALINAILIIHFKIQNIDAITHELYDYLTTIFHLFFIPLGIFLLQKKKFVLNWILALLIISFLLESSSMVHQYLTNPSFKNVLILRLIIPAFYLSLLIWAYKLKKSEYQADENLKVQSSQNIITLKASSLLGVLFFTLPLSLVALWIYATNQKTTHAESVLLFNKLLPTWLEGQFHSTYLAMILCLLAFIASVYGLNLKQSTWRILNNTVLVSSTLLLLWFLFSLM